MDHLTIVVQVNPWMSFPDALANLVSWMGQSKKENIWQDRRVKVADWFCVFVLRRGAGGAQQVPHQGQLPDASGETAENEAKNSGVVNLETEAIICGVITLGTLYTCEHGNESAVNIKYWLAAWTTWWQPPEAAGREPVGQVYTRLVVDRGLGDLESNFGGRGWVSRAPSCRGLRLSMFSKPLGVGCFFFYIPSQRSLPDRIMSHYWL